MREHLDTEADGGADNWVVNYSEAAYAALNGDVDSALLALQAALNSGYRIGAGFESRVFRNLDGEPKFKELLQTMASYVDEERAKLGMDPYLPVSALDEQKKGAVWQP
jgi:hypothetical protein